MKVLTIKQPWASLIANGYKEYEFRSWKTKYRGPLLIHAGKGIDKKAIEKFKDLNLEYPKSQIIALVQLNDCILIDKSFNEKLCNNRFYGHHDKTNLYAWQLSKIKKVNNKNHVKGRLGLWDMDSIDC